MKTTKQLFGILTITAGLAMQVHAQVYQLSTPISGSITINMIDWAGPSGSSGNFQLNVTNFTETIYLDPVAQTIRQVGSISVTPSAQQQIVINETQQIPQPFPNPPRSVSGVITVNLSLSGGNTLSFDTGPQAITWSSASQAYTFDGNIYSFLNPINGSYSLVTGGQTLTGSFSYSLQGPYGAGGPAWTFDKLTTFDYPTAISLGGLGNNQYAPGTYSSQPEIVADVTAANGFHMQLFPGYAGVSVAAGYLYWSCGQPVTATNVPAGAASITNQPHSVVVHAYDPASFSVRASGTVPLSYQWALNGTNISGATSSSVTISNVTQSDLGAYAVVVTNQFGSDTSSNAVLSMYPFLAVPFAGAVGHWGQNTTLSVQVWGTGPLSYQWFQNGNAILNATNQTLDFPSIQFTNAGLYSVVVSSALGSVTNTPALVIVYPAGVSLGFSPTLTIQGVIGYSYLIQRTADLSNTNSWLTMTNLTLTQPVQLWVDTSVDASSPFNSKYFYQVLPGQ